MNVKISTAVLFITGFYLAGMLSFLGGMSLNTVKFLVIFVPTGIGIVAYGNIMARGR